MQEHMMINMKKVNYAAIDIGSNAVRLLIKCVNEENAPELMSKVVVFVLHDFIRLTVVEHSFDNCCLFV